jgi:hypothetical protein
VKKLLLAAAVAATSLAPFGLAPAQAAGCTITDFMQDGHPLTASQVNPAAVTGTVDATGCDIAVYFNDAASHTVDAAVIENAFYYGVLVRNPGTSATITNSEVRFIGDGNGGMFLPTGAQHGNGIRFRDGASGLVDNSYIHHYQKGGVVVSNPGTTATVTNSHVQGLGPVDFIAQNGIQYSDHSAGEVRGNLIEDHEYTGPQDTFSTGLLLFDIEPPQIKRSLNHYRDNDRNEVVIPSASLK